MTDVKALEALINKPKAMGSSRITVHTDKDGICLWSRSGRKLVDDAVMATVTAAGWVFDRKDFDDLGDDDCPKHCDFHYFKRGSNPTAAA